MAGSFTRQNRIDLDMAAQFFLYVKARFSAQVKQWEFADLLEPYPRDVGKRWRWYSTEPSTIHHLHLEATTVIPSKEAVFLFIPTLMQQYAGGTMLQAIGC